MKKALILAMALLSLRGLNAQSSEYRIFPEIQAMWNFTFYQNCFGAGVAEANYSLVYSGDTVINGLNYYKLNRPFVEMNSSGSCGGLSVGYQGAIRQDVSQKKVYFVEAGKVNEELLYDFNLQVGDTIKGYLANPSFNVDVVREIDTIMLDNQPYKRWFINKCYQIYIIEGIGSTYGLIKRSPSCVTDQASYSLSCMRRTGQPVYPSANYSCQMINSVASYSGTQGPIVMSPNPITDRGVLRFNGRLEDARFKVEAISGQTVFVKDHINGTEMEWNREGLVAGVYIGKLEQAGQVLGIVKMVIGE